MHLNDPCDTAQVLLNDGSGRYTAYKDTQIASSWADGQGTKVMLGECAHPPRPTPVARSRSSCLAREALWADSRAR